MNRQISERHTVGWPAGLLVSIVLLFVFWNPVGYVGGGADDDRYLAGALCWVESGPCLPVNHWEGRWPLVSTLALAIEAFGFNRFSLALPSALASLACLFLLKWLGDRLFEKPVGTVAALTFALLPVFAILALSATVEPFELAFILGSAAALVTRKPLLAGLAFALAFQVRETAAAALVPFAALLWRDWRSMALFSAGFAAPMLVELLAFYLSTGDPLHRRGLSIRHTLLPSSELQTVVKSPPIFNFELLKYWKYEPGIDLHWAVNGFANLMVNFKTGLLFFLVPFFACLYRSRLDPADRRGVTFLIGSAFVYAAVLIYVLAIDPKPRMMFVPLAFLALAFGIVASRAWNIVILATACTLVPIMGLLLFAQPRHSHWERAAKDFHARYPNSIETSQPGYFAFAPELRRIPPIGSGRPYLLVLKSEPCSVPASEDPVILSHLEIVGETRGAFIPRALGFSWSLCLFRYLQQPRAHSPANSLGPWQRLRNDEALPSAPLNSA